MKIISLLVLALSISACSEIVMVVPDTATTDAGAEPDASDVQPDAADVPDAGTPDAPDAAVDAPAPADAGTDAPVAPDAPEAPVDAPADAPVPTDSPEPVDAGPVVADIAVVTSSRCALLVTGEFFCWEPPPAFGGSVTVHEHGMGLDAEGRCVRRNSGEVVCLDSSRVEHVISPDPGPGIIARYSTAENGAVYNPATGSGRSWTGTSRCPVAFFAHGDAQPVVTLINGACAPDGVSRGVRIGVNRPREITGNWPVVDIGMRSIGITGEARILRLDGGVLHSSTVYVDELLPTDENIRTDGSLLCAERDGNLLCGQDVFTNDLGDVLGPWNITREASGSSQVCFTSSATEITCATVEAGAITSSYIVTL